MKYDKPEVRVLCIDPGGTTGYAMLGATATFHMRNGRVQKIVPGIQVLEHGESPLWQGLPRLIALADYVVIERFALYASKSKAMVNSTFPSSQVIGVVRYFTDEYHKPLFFQNASTIHYKGKINPALKFGVDSLLPTGGHQRDAVAHGIHILHHGKLKGVFRNVPRPTHTTNA